MCRGCWENYGSPAIVNARTVAAADKVARIYEFSMVGGDAHVVVDDWNLSDETVQWCLTEGMAMNVHEHTPEQKAIVREALEALAALPLDERASAMAIFDRFVAARETGNGGGDG
jgi:hypothetical protein